METSAIRIGTQATIGWADMLARRWADGPLPYLTALALVNAFAAMAGMDVL